METEIIQAVIDPATAMMVYAGAKAVGKGFQWIHNRYSLGNKPKFADSAYGEYLKKMQKEGKYSPEAQGRIESSVSRTAGQVASDQSSDYRGRLISRGMGNSIAGIRGDKDIEQRRIKAVADVSDKIATENELSKKRAGETLAKGTYSDKLATWKAKTDMDNKAIGDLATSVGDVTTAYAGYKNPTDLKSLTKKALEGDDWTEVIANLTNQGWTEGQIEYYILQTREQVNPIPPK